jgi:CxxC motif-containing protein
MNVTYSSLGVLDTTLCDKKLVSDLPQVNHFLQELQFSPPIKLTDILLKEALNTINHLPSTLLKVTTRG